MREVILYKPITVFGFLIALRTLIYGIGYLIPTTGFVDTVLFIELVTLVSAPLAGMVFVAIALAMMYALVRQSEALVGTTFSINAFVWLFAFFIYFLAGTPLLGLAIAGVFSIASGYVGFAFKNRHDAAAYNALIDK